MFYLGLPIHRRSALRPSRGFTLIELLAGVAIMTVLSVVAVVGFRQHMSSARGTEALSVIQAIRSAQESYMAENKMYVNVSTSKGGVDWYPQPVQNTKRAAWSNSKHLDNERWQQLAPSIKQTVMFGYLVNAGVPGSVIPDLQVKRGPDLKAPQPSDWYLIQARGDVDGDGLYSLYATTNLATGEIYIEDQGE